MRGELEGKPLHIVFTVDPEIPVPPRHYGGIERIVDMLVRGLQERGHAVHLFANPASKASGHLHPYRGRRSRSIVDTLTNALQVGLTVRELDPVDLVHSFGRLAYLLPLLRSRVPKIQSYQRKVTRRSVRLGCLLANGSLSFTACSASCAAEGRVAGGRWTVIHNGVPAADYSFRASVPPDAPLVCLGRVERIKGVHTAIEVAKQTGRRLVIAGNRAPSGPGRAYFDAEIAPRCDGDTIEYVGAVTDEQKNALLGRAAALLFPIEWDEPFGIVMTEALACGTPVLATPRGAVPEVIRDGVNGFLCASVEEMVTAVGRIGALDRGRCRKTFEERFSDHVIVDRYERLYRRLVANGGA